MDIKVQRKILTVEEAEAKLKAIFDGLQANPATHDKWDWMKAGFYLDVITTMMRRDIDILRRALLIRARRDRLPSDTITPEERVDRWIEDAKESLQPVVAEEQHSVNGR